MILVGTQIERFINKGTILGYGVRDVKSKQAKARQNKSGSIIGGTVSKENQKSIACDTFPANKVSEVLQSEVDRISGFVPDKTEPNIVSSCIYRTKGAAAGIRTVSILLREQKDSSTAQRTLATLRDGGKGEEVKGVGDEAYFNTGANQLTVRRDKRLITVTVPGSEDSKQDSKTTAVAIAKLGL